MCPHFKEEISTIIVGFYKFSITRTIYFKEIVKFSISLLLLQEFDWFYFKEEISTIIGAFYKLSII